MLRRTRITLMGDAVGQPEGGSERPEGARRFLIKASPNSAALRVLIGMLLGGGSALVLLRDRIEFASLLAAVFFCGLVCTLLIVWLFPPPRVCVFVGVDGVVVWGRFIPYAAIKGVRQEWRHRAAGSSSDGYTAWPEADIWTIFLDLRSGESLRVESLVYDRSGIDTGVPERQNERGVEVVRAMKAGLAARRARHRGPEPYQEELIARGERTGHEWVEALRRLGSGATAAYRGLPVDLEGLSRVLAEPQARPSTRAAAAVALVAGGDEAAAKKLRIAAAEMADPRLRIALEKVADEAKDAAVVEALEALESLERDTRTSRTT